MQILDAFAVFEQQRAGVAHRGFGDAVSFLVAPPVAVEHLPFNTDQMLYSKGSQQRDEL